MRNIIHSSLVTAFAFAAPLFAAVPAHAGIEACGDIHVEAQAECEVLVGPLCEAECRPLSFTAACYAECDGGCNASVDASCSASCEAECSADCEVNPAQFDCYASCESSCKADAYAHCSGSSNEAQCRASFEASCEGECSASCEYTPGSASCEAKCEASCDGECRAEANASCQIDCQGECTAELQGGCEIECQAPEGALFCDGQYVDHGGNFEECLDSLNAILEGEVNVEASASASCVNGHCQAEGLISCASAGGPARGGAAWLVAAAALGLCVAARRRRS